MMYIQQIYTNCLAEAAYYIESNGEAAIIDPLREPAPYLELAEERNATIKYVLETHFHADFISGHLDLAKKTGAEIIYGPTASQRAQYPITEAEDGQLLPLGNIQLKVMHTPGHTLESSCFLAIDEEGNDTALFSGDTLFIGDVGRPDLAVKSDTTKEDLAGMLYESLHKKVLRLEDDVVVYPGHGEGSQCGKSLSSDKYSTIGNQKETNYALSIDSKEGFVEEVLNGLLPPPQYFPKVAQINQAGYAPLEQITKSAFRPLSPADFEQLLQEASATILDTRSASSFSQGHITGSLHIGLNGQFAVWAGTIIKDLDTPLILICETGTEAECIKRLARVGYENVLGFLNDGIEAWISENRPVEQIINICPENFSKLEDPGVVLDVRTPHEYNEGHVEGANNVPLAELIGRLTDLQKDLLYTVYCKSGYRSAIACSILRRHGMKDVKNVKKGYLGITESSTNDCCTI